MKWNPVNGTYLLSGGRDYKIKLYDIRKIEKEVKQFDGHKDAILTVQWHPFKEEIFASADQLGTISFWKQSYGKLHDIKNAHNKNIYNMDWHPTGTMLASTGHD